MKKTTDPKKKRLELRMTLIRNLDLLKAAHGGMMNLNPRTDCNCCKACATMYC